jgi:zinc protease
VEFGGHGLASDYTLLTDLLSEILMEPTFPEVEWEKLRGQILTQLGVLDTDTSYRADREFEAALYPVGHPFARPVMGTRETVSALGVRQLLAFHGAYYRPAVLTIAVVGAVEPERAIGELAARLGRWPAGQAARQGAIPWVETPQGIVTRRVELPAKAQVELVWGVVGLERISPQYYAAMMANLILGRLGLMGRLGANLRDDQGLAYYVSSALDAGHGPQPWSIMAGVHSSNIERTVASILDEVVRLREEPVRDEELADGKSYLTGVLPLRLETNEGIAQVLLDIEDYDLGLDYLQRYPGIIEVISSQEVQRAARDYLTPDRYVLAMAGTFAPS